MEGLKGKHAACDDARLANGIGGAATNLVSASRHCLENRTSRNRSLRKYDLVPALPRRNVNIRDTSRVLGVAA